MFFCNRPQQVFSGLNTTFAGFYNRSSIACSEKEYRSSRVIAIYLRTCLKGTSPNQWISSDSSGSLSGQRHAFLQPDCRFWMGPPRMFVCCAGCDLCPTTCGHAHHHHTSHQGGALSLEKLLKRMRIVCFGACIFPSGMYFSWEQQMAKPCPWLIQALEHRQNKRNERRLTVTMAVRNFTLYSTCSHQKS